MIITVKDRQKAFEVAGKMFPTDYERDDVASVNAGYHIYRHGSINTNNWISDLGTRLEVNVDGKTTNILIDGENEKDECTCAADFKTEVVSAVEAGSYIAITLKSKKKQRRDEACLERRRGGLRL